MPRLGGYYDCKESGTGLLSIQDFDAMDQSGQQQYYHIHPQTTSTMKRKPLPGSTRDVLRTWTTRSRSTTATATITTAGSQVEYDYGTGTTWGGLEYAGSDVEERDIAENVLREEGDCVPIAELEGDSTSMELSYAQRIAIYEGFAGPAISKEKLAPAPAPPEKEYVYTSSSFRKSSPNALAERMSQPTHYQGAAQQQQRQHYSYIWDPRSFPISEAELVDFSRPVSEKNAKNGGYKRSLYIPSWATSSLTSLDGSNGESANGWEESAAHPRNFPRWKKLQILATIILTAFISSTSVSLMTPSVPNLQLTYHLTEITATLAFSLYVSGWVLGPLVMAPLSELWGRNCVLIPSWLCFIAFSAGAGAAKSWPALLAMRFFQGISSAPHITVVSGCITDIFSPDEASPPSGVFVAVSHLGPVIGPLAGGYLTQYVDFHWPYWLSTIMAAAVLPLVVLLPETHAPTVFRRKLRRGKDSFAAQDSTTLLKLLPAEPVLERLCKSILTPLLLLSREPLIAFCAFSVGLTSAILYIYFGVYPRVFRVEYKMPQGNASLPFLGIGLGIVLALPAIKYHTCLLAKKRSRGEHVRDEDAMFLGIIAAAALPASVFWFAWTGRSSVHYLVPTFSGLPFGWSVITLFITQIVYVGMRYEGRTASVVAAILSVRSVFLVVLPLGIPGLYNALGPQKAGSVVGGLAVLAMPVPWVFWKYGEKIRSWGKSV